MNITLPMAKALSVFHEKCPDINLDGQVEFKGVKFKYATLGNILEKIKAPLKEAGLTFFHTINPEGSCVTCVLVCCEDGSTITSSISTEFTGMPQTIGSKITYFKRYTLQGVLGIVAEEDNDGAQSMQIEKAQFNDTMMAAAITRVRANDPKDRDLIATIASKFVVSQEQLDELYKVKFEL